MQSHSWVVSNRSSAETCRGPIGSNEAWHSAAWHPSPPAPALEPGDLRVLIVNEDTRSAESLRRTLRDLGYFTTYIAYSARRAIELADELAPAIALLDLDLPDMTGFQLAQQLRAHGRSHVREMRLLAVAERSLLGDRDCARAVGFIGCLTKPVPPLELDLLMRTSQS